MKDTINKLAVACLLSILLFLLLMAGAVADTSGDYVYKLNCGKATITGYTGAGGNVTIPSTLDGYPVVAIGVNAFDLVNSLTSVTIPNGVKSIGFCAFGWCNNLTSVTIPSSVTSIGKCAFFHCSSLISVTIPKDVTSIGEVAFGLCTGLSSLTVDTANTKFASSDGVLFSKEKTELIQYPLGKTGTDYTIPSSVKVIARYAFYGSKLKSIMIPSTLTSIEQYAFKECDNLYDIKVAADPVSLRAASASCTSIKLTWDKVTGTSGYEIYRAASNTGAYTKVATVKGGATVTYTNTKLNTGTAYYFKVRACWSAGSYKVYGDYSEVISATPVPAAPSSLKAARVSATSVKLTWKAVSGATKYELYRATAEDGTYMQVKETASLSITDTGLTKDKTWYYKVRAFHLEGSNKVYGEYSAIVSIKP